MDQEMTATEKTVIHRPKREKEVGTARQGYSGKLTRWVRKQTDGGTWTWPSL